MVVTWDAWLVTLSIVVAILASYVGLDLASRVTFTKSRGPVNYWLIGGALSIGLGIWSMHFVGMLALRLPIPVAYDGWTTLASLAIAVISSGLGLFIVSRDTVAASRILAGGTLVGSAIVAMHFTGMAAMRMQPPIRYDTWLVALSVAIAIGSSMAALAIAFKVRMESFFTAVWKKIGGGLALGIAISGMHYVAMEAARFAPDSICTVGGPYVNSTGLAYAVGNFSVIFLAATLLISALDAYRAETAAHRTAQLEERVSQRTAELARAHRQLIEVQESERRQLSGELHDRVGQNLTALGINLDILKNKPHMDHDVPKRIEDCIALVDATADTIENVMSELSPPMLDDHGLLAALQWYANAFSQRSAIEAAVHGEERQDRPCQDVELTLFRIAQEALTNVAKHSGATKVEITLDQAGDECFLVVSDNGIGIEPGRPEPGARPSRGVASMRERVRAVGGRFEVRSTPGQGTQVTVRIPKQI